MTEEIKRKISISEKGKIISDEIKEKISNTMRGRKYSIERCRNISNSLKGNIPWNKGKTGIYSPEALEKMSKSHEGQILSEEHKNKISDMMKGRIIYWKDKIANAQKGEKSKNWRGGISYLPYCHKFNKELKNKIRERDNYQCQNPECLHTQLESIGIHKKKLHIHHIHYDKENCYPDLITLCNSCNSKANSNKNYWEQLFMEILKKRNLLNYFGDIK